MFVQSNHGDEEATRITYLTFIGTPVQATNMNDFKRVSLCFLKALMNVLNLPKNESTEQIHLVVVVILQLKVDLAFKTKHVALSYSSLVLPLSFCSSTVLEVFFVLFLLCCFFFFNFRFKYAYYGISLLRGLCIPEQPKSSESENTNPPFSTVEFYLLGGTSS